MPPAHALPSSQSPLLIPEKALIMSGFGINSEMETREALLRAGMDAEIVHINDLIAGCKRLADYRLLVFPGGFSYGDDTGAGNAYANRLRNNLWDDLLEFIDGDNLVLGICNGFQILANLGLVPAFDQQYARDIALMPNRRGRLECRFVTIRPAAEQSGPWDREALVPGLPRGRKFLLLCRDPPADQEAPGDRIHLLPGGPEPGWRRIPL